MKVKKCLSGVLALAMVFQSAALDVSAAGRPEAKNPVTQIVSEPETVYVNAYDAKERSTLFNDHWRFYLGELNGAEAVMYNDSGWKNVDLPHDYSIDQGYTTAAPAEQESGYVLGGTGWYRKSFSLSEDMMGKEISIDFDGVYMNATVYLNGKQLGTHPYGYTPFSFRLPNEELHFGGQENILAVKVEHKQPSSRWYSGSGIYRDVTLTVTDPVHVAWFGTTVTTPDIKDGKGTVHVTASVQNDSENEASVSVRQVVYEAGKEEPVAQGEWTQPQTIAAGKMADIAGTATVASPKLWSGEEPNLYTVRTEVRSGDALVDSYDSDFGFRWVTFTKDNGFFLNGKNMKLKGVSMHHDQGGLGSEAWERAIERQVEKLLQMGVNAIRVTHNPASQVLIDVCNRKGMMLVEEAFDCWLSGKAGNTEDFGKWFSEPIEEGNQIVGGESCEQWAEFDLKAMVKRGRNHPSIVMWSLGNEVFQQLINSNQNSQFPDVAKKLIRWTGEEDTTRFVTFGDNQMKGAVNNDNNIATKTANVIGAASEYGDVPGGLVGFNYGSFSQIQQGYQKGWHVYGSETASSINSRGVYDRKNNGSDGGKGDKRLTSYDKSRVSWGHLASDGLFITLRQPYNAGEFVWTGFDYIGEPTPDNWQGTGANGTWPNIAKNSYFGIIDTAGFPKDSFYLYQSQWNDSVHTLHVLPVWNRDEIVLDGNGRAEVVVYSDAPVIKLFLNGTEVGSATVERTDTPTGGYQNYTQGTGCFDVSKSGIASSSSLYATFLVPYEEGKLEAKAYEADGVTELTDTDGRSFVETTKVANKLQITADRKEITADGKDLSYITIDVTDRDGKFVNSAEPEITVSVEGAGKLLALDNGVQNDVTAHSEPTRKAGKGKLLAIVQSTDKAGGFTVTASAPGFQDVKETVNTKEGESGSSEKYVVSYEISRNYYLKPNTVPTLPKAAVIHYSDGTSETKTVTWGDIPSGEDAYVISGVVADLNLGVQVNVMEIKGVAKILNYSAAIGKGAQISLPAARPAVLSDGSVMTAEFPVTWDIPANLTETVGTKEVTGVAEVFEEEFEVSASLRVTSGGYRDGDEALPNVPEMYINGISSAQNSSVADAFLKLKDGKASKNDTAWSGRGTLDFRLDTAIELKDFTLYIKDTAPISNTMKVYSSNDNGANWTKADCKITNRKENGVTVRTFTPSDTVSETWFRLEFEKITTLLELEMNTRIPTFPVGKEAALSSLHVGGHIADAKTLEKGWYGVADTSLDVADIKAAGKDNASVTVLPKDAENKIRIVLESEDHSVRGVYQILLGKDNLKTENANDDSLDYPYEKMTLTAPSYQTGNEPAKANDNNNSSIWHTSWGGGIGETNLKEFPQLRYLQIELTGTEKVKGLRYRPRSSQTNGSVTKYSIQVSATGQEEDYKEVAAGEWSTAVEWKLAQCDPVDAKYIRLYGVQTAADSVSEYNQYMSAAEVRVQCAANEIYAGNTTAVLPEGEDTADYTGQKIEPEPVVTYKASEDAEGIVLEKDVNYQLSYRNNIEPGTATIVVTGMGSYTGVVETEFTIRPVDVTVKGYEKLAVTTAKGEYPPLPGTITAETTVGAQLAEVRWDSISSSILNRFGTFTVYGTAVGTGDRVAAKVTVSDVIGVQQVTLATVRGKTPTMPKQVNVYYSNGDVAKRDVTWNMPDGGFDKAGTVIVTGKVQKAEVKASVRVAEGEADKNNTPADKNLALNKAGVSSPKAWPRTFAYISASGDPAHHATDGVKDFVSDSSKSIWSDWESGRYHTNADAAVGANDHLPFVATAFGQEGSVNSADQKKYTVNKVSVGFMEEDGTSAHKVRLPKDYRIEYYSGSDGVIAANRLENDSAANCSNTKGWAADNPIKAHDGWSEVTYVGGKPAVPDLDSFKQMVDIFFAPVETTAIRIVLTPQAENWTGLEEFEVYYEPVTRNDSYEISAIRVDGRDVKKEFDETTNTLELDASAGEVTAEATDNASVTVLEAVNGVVKVVFLPENENEAKKQEYLIKFKQAEEKETFVVAAEESEVEMTGVAAAGETVTFSAKEGYAFTELPVIVRSDTNEPTGIVVTALGVGYTFVMPAYAVTIRGSVKEQENQIYTVQFESNGGSAVASQEVSSAVGVLPEPAAPIRRGYDFAGWYRDRDLTDAWNFASAVTGNMTLYAKWAPANITVNTKFAARLFTDDAYEMPDRINISVTGETFDTAVSWKEEDVEKLLGATELSEHTIKGTLTEFENREIAVTITASPAGIVYFVDSGASEFTKLGQMLVDANRKTMKNSAPDGAYSESAGWGYTNPQAELEVNGSGSAYESIRNFIADVNGKTLTYQFALEAGTYEVVAGFYDPWAQYANDNRHAKVTVADGAGVILAEKADHNIKDKELVSFTDITIEKAGNICLNVIPIHTGKDSDVMVSFIVIRKTAEFTNEKAALASAVAIAEKLSAADYTVESYAALLTAIQEAKAVLRSGASTIQQVQEKTEAIAAAMTGLKSASEEELKDLRKQISDLSGQLEKARGKVSDLEAKITLKDQEISGLKGQLSQKETDLKEANDKLVDLKKELGEANGDISDLQYQVSEKETEISILQNQISDLNSQIQDKKDDKENLLKELKAVKEEAGVLEMKLSAAQARVLELERKADQMQKETEEAKKQLAAANDEITKLEKEAVELKKSVLQLRESSKNDVKGVRYRVINVAKREAEAYAISNKSVSSIQIPSTVKISGVTCKVTAIADNAFANAKKLRKAVIGKNVTSIGKKAFFGCKKLTSVTIRNKDLSKIGKNAFKGISAKAKIYVPKGKLKAFQKRLNGKGQKKSVQVKAEKR